MVKQVNAGVSEDAHERLVAEKERRGLSWSKFLEEISHEICDEE